jgi:hypothetical protein
MAITPQTRKNINNLMRRIQRANASLKTKGAMYEISPIIAQRPTSAKEYHALKRRVDTWQKRKRFLQKREKFFYEAEAYNRTTGSRYSHRFNALPKNEAQLKNYRKYLQRLSKAGTQGEREKVSRSIISEMRQHGYLKGQKLVWKPDNSPKEIRRGLSELTQKSNRMLKFEFTPKFFNAISREGSISNFNYHLNFEDAARTAGLDRLADFIKKESKWFSYYLYLKDFEIPDFYLMFKAGSTISEIYTKMRDLLKYALYNETQYDNDEYNNKIRQLISLIENSVDEEYV